METIFDYNQIKQIITTQNKIVEYIKDNSIFGGHFPNYAVMPVFS